MAPLSRVALAAAALAVLSAADSAEGARPRPSFHTGTQQRTPSSQRASGRQSIAFCTTWARGPCVRPRASRAGKLVLLYWVDKAQP